MSQRTIEDKHPPTKATVSQTGVSRRPTFRPKLVGSEYFNPGTQRSCIAPDAHAGHFAHELKLTIRGHHLDGTDQSLIVPIKAGGLSTSQAYFEDEIDAAVDYYLRGFCGQDLKDLMRGNR
uniref:Uncharacterized protein n=1 Tax=Kwoniella bestiolae CBS 10118 TaxID=1296100 RepID=A0A1B9GFN4_9TREE|nr:hypothetical protein I302_01329 [Kwoniella bestiolae CBS 10118]OCF29816.1 hypothetical protein I302_01329 [Kwoniella bestiolae CBS 10118]